MDVPHAYSHQPECGMRMSNYLRVKLEGVAVMAATESSFGMRHPTVVPTNFEPTESVDEAGAADEESADDEPPVDSE